MNDRHAKAQRLEGYLQAVAALRADGTAYACFDLGTAAPAESLPALCERLALPVAGCTLDLVDAVLPQEFEEMWLLRRIRPMSTSDELRLDRRLVDGFVEELRELFDGLPQWFALRRGAAVPPSANLGAISDVFVIGRAGASFAVRCSWDS